MAFFDAFNGDARLLCAVQSPGVRLVAEDDGQFQVEFARLCLVNKGLQIRAAAGDEDSGRLW